MSAPVTRVLTVSSGLGKRRRICANRKKFQKLRAACLHTRITQPQREYIPSSGDPLFQSSVSGRTAFLTVRNEAACEREDNQPGGALASSPVPRLSGHSLPDTPQPVRVARMDIGEKINSAAHWH